MTLPSTTDVLADLIRRRHDCLRELLALAREQQERVASDDVDGLLAILSRKQPHLDALQRLAGALKPFGGDDPERRVWPDPGQRAECQCLWDESTTMVEEIVTLERASEQALRERRDEVGRQLHASHSTHHVHRAYLHGRGPSTTQTGNQLDLTEA